VREPIIEVRNLTKVYRNGVVANDNISFDVERGEVFGILGPNGAGKTTLIRQLAGLLKPTSGSIRVAGVDVVREPQRVKKHLSLCPQETAVLGHLTVFEHLYYFGRLRGLPAERARREAEELIERFGLGEYRGRYVSSLSRGLQRRVIVAQAFLGSTEIVVLDEPTAGLDPVGRRHVWSLIREYSRGGVTVLLTTHYMDEAEALSTRVMFLRRGRVVAIGPVEAVKRMVGEYVKIRVSCLYREVVEEILRGVDGGVRVLEGREGQYLEIVVPAGDGGGDALRRIVELLLAHGVEFELRKPSLEDVFLEVAGGGAGEDAA